jgi:hypothetical protein
MLLRVICGIWETKPERVMLSPSLFIFKIFDYNLVDNNKYLPKLFSLYDMMFEISMISKNNNKNFRGSKKTEQS